MKAKDQDILIELAKDVGAIKERNRITDILFNLKRVTLNGINFVQLTEAYEKING